MSPRRKPLVIRRKAPKTQDLSRPIWKLPMELWIMIVDCGLKSSTGTLVALIRTSKHLAQNLTWCLYRGIRCRFHYTDEDSVSVEDCHRILQLFRTLATSNELASCMRELDLKLGCSFPPSMSPYAPPPVPSTYYKRAALVEAEDRAAAKLNKWISNLSILLLRGLKNIRTELIALTLGGNLFETVLAKNLKLVQGFPKLKRLFLNCEGNTLTSVLELFEFVGRLSLEELFFESGEVLTFLIGQKPNEGRRLSDLLCKSIATLPTSSPDLHTLDLHLSFLIPTYLDSSTIEEIEASLERIRKALQHLVLPAIRDMHMRLDYPGVIDTFKDSYKSHAELRGENVAVTWPSRCCLNGHAESLPLLDSDDELSGEED